MTPRRCPFFGEITERQHRNPRFSWRLFAAGAASERWRQAQLWMRSSWPGATLLLPDTDPMSVRWAPGTVIADATNQPSEIVQRLAQALLRDGCTHVLFVDLADPSRSTHVKRSPQQVAA